MDFDNPCILLTSNLGRDHLLCVEESGFKKQQLRRVLKRGVQQDCILHASLEVIPKWGNVIFTWSWDLKDPIVVDVTFALCNHLSFHEPDVKDGEVLIENRYDEAEVVLEHGEFQQQLWIPLFTLSISSVSSWVQMSLPLWRGKDSGEISLSILHSHCNVNWGSTPDIPTVYFGDVDSTCREERGSMCEREGNVKKENGSTRTRVDRGIPRIKTWNTYNSSHVKSLVHFVNTPITDNSRFNAEYTSLTPWYLDAIEDW